VRDTYIGKELMKRRDYLLSELKKYKGFSDIEAEDLY
jgi:hypothetical protein